MYLLQSDKGKLLDFFENHLLNEVMPFWIKNCIDRKHGGISNLVTDEGVVISDDKYVWSQGRALYTFSALYNHIKKKPEYLEIAEGIAGFILKNRNPEGDWCFILASDGSVIDPQKSIYVDAFVCAGLTEYAVASGRKDIMDAAFEIFERVSPTVYEHMDFPVAPLFYPKGLQGHGPLMHITYAFNLLGRATGNDKVLKRVHELAHRIMDQHLDPKNGLLFEFVMPGGGEAWGDYGKTIVTGHSIEEMWFLEEVFDYFGECDMSAKTFESTRAHLEFGWDKEYGGLYLARHTEGGIPKWHNPDTKSWWPQVETLYSILRAYEVTNDDWCMEWFQRVYDYIFSHYPNPEFGEWHHCLDREGNIRSQIATIPVKDPYHMPRALIKIILSLRRMIIKEADTSFIQEG